MYSDRVDSSIPKGRNKGTAKKGWNKRQRSRSSGWGLWQNHLGSRVLEWPATAGLPLEEHTQPFWAGSIPCLQLSSRVFPWFPLQRGFTFMWWLLGAALQGLWCCYTLSGVSSSVHGTSTQDSLLTQWTTIFNACKTCTKWLMLIRSGASLRSSLSTLDHSCIIHSLCAADPGETLPQWLFSNRKLYVPIRFLMFCFVFVFDIRFHYIALPGQL